MYFQLASLSNINRTDQDDFTVMAAVILYN